MQGKIVYRVPFFQVPDELIDDVRTTSYHVAAFAVLAMHANKDGEAWPSVRRVAKLMRCGVTKAREALTDLEAFGWLEIHERTDTRTGVQSSNLYRLSTTTRTEGDAPPPDGPPPPPDGGGTPRQTDPPPPPRGPEPDPLNQTQSEPLPAQTPERRRPAPMKDPLCRLIDDWFLDFGDYPSFGKERAAVTRCAQLSIADRPDDPHGLANAMMRALQWLTENGDDWWRAQPLLPSTLRSHWRRIEKTMRERIQLVFDEQSEVERLQRFRNGQ